MPPPLITVIGLGPADDRFLTAEAITALAEATPLYLRTARHPAAGGPLANGAIALDHHYEHADRFDEVYAGIVEELVAAATAEGEIGYAVPGSPLVLESTVARLHRDPRVTLRIVGGLSFLDLAWQRLDIDPVDDSIRLVDAERFAEQGAGERGPLLVAQTWSGAQLSAVKLAFEEPPDISVVLLHHLGLPDEVVIEVPFSELDRTLVPDHLTCLFLPQVAAPVDFELGRAVRVVSELRQACPWDSEQTHQSLVRHLLEESYEAIEAIEALGEEPEPEAIAHVEEELGDVLCQVLFHSTIAAEEGWFNLSDVAGGLADKLIHRHPHVYGSAEEGEVDAEDVLGRWEAAKREEKGRASLLDGIPPALPALAMTAKLERRLREVRLATAPTAELRAQVTAALDALFAGNVETIGPILLALGRLAAALGGEPEEELRRANEALRQRFVSAEERAGGRPEDLVATPELLAELGSLNNIPEQKR